MKKMIVLFFAIITTFMSYMSVDAMIIEKKLEELVKEEIAKLKEIVKKEVEEELKTIMIKEAETTVEKEMSKIPFSFLTKPALSGLIPAIATSFLTKTKLQKLWHIPVGIGSWLLMHNLQTNYRSNKPYDKNAIYKQSKISSTNFAFMIFYGAGVLAVEGTRGLKKLSRYALRQ